MNVIPDSKVHGAIMGPIWGRQDPGGPHAGAMNFAIWDIQQVTPVSEFRKQSETSKKKKKKFRLVIISPRLV